MRHQHTDGFLSYFSIKSHEILCSHTFLRLLFFCQKRWLPSRIFGSHFGFSSFLKILKLFLEFSVAFCFNLCIWIVNKKKISILFRVINIFEKITDNLVFAKIKGHKSCNFPSIGLKICIQVENTFQRRFILWSISKYASLRKCDRRICQ